MGNAPVVSSWWVSARSAWGVFRSIAIYHAIPGRARKLRHFYAGFVSSGDVCFDLGAHVGNRTRAWRQIGASVIAVEPQPACLSVLRRLFGHDEKVTIVPEAIGGQRGQADLFIDPANPTIATLSADWIAESAADPGFRKVHWDQRLSVPVTTLQDLIVRFGEPAFVKIDVEGLESEVLRGVEQALACLSFEYLPAARQSALDCISRLQQLGCYEYNRSCGESLQLASAQWLTAKQMNDFIAGLQIGDNSGDIYARLLPGVR